jgi:UDP-N-acetylglucosamine--N-acetylmuramyl-(pentapeptide) pyrophosphoryl-undecaprenol N-acetylglucosamine transferase
LFPGLAVAEELRRLEPEAAISFLTTTRTLDGELLEQTGFEQITQPVQPLTLHPARLPGFWWSWRKSVRAARALFKQQAPRAVLGLGGYAAGPAVVAAHALGIRTAILNPDALPGRANRYLARCADLVIMQWEEARQHFARGTNCRTLGCPIRAAFASASRAKGRQHFGLNADRPTLLVTGASQGARTVNRVMQRVWPEFAAEHPNWQILHLSGPSDEQDTRAAYAAAGAEANVIAFTHDMALALAAADAVVSRAGASTLAELTALSLPSILLPYPYHRDRHQHANARVLVEAQAAMLIEDRLDPEANRGPVLEGLRRLADPTVRHKMSEAAGRLARRDAATSVAQYMAEQAAF